MKKCNESLSNGEHEAAMSEVIAALAIESSNYTARIFKGKIFAEQKKFAAAEKVYLELIEEEPEKILAFRGLASTYQAAHQFDQMLDINLRMIKDFAAELGDKRPQLIDKSVELSTSMENWPVWREIFNLVEESQKNAIVLAFWERIPFRIIEEYDLSDRIPKGPVS